MGASEGRQLNREKAKLAHQQKQHPFLALLHASYGQEMAKEGARLASPSDRQFAQWLDQLDPLRAIRQQFHIPRMATLPGVDLSLVEAEEESIYLCGNSVGLQPKSAEKYLRKELRQWAEMGVHAHFHGPEPWYHCDDRLLDKLAELVGAKSAKEVALMNSTTVNIHLLLTAFFRPTSDRFKILLESGAFPSDFYAVESQLRLNGLDPAEAMVCMEPREGEECLRTEDILDLLESEGHSIAVVFFAGVQYYTGQLFDIEQITRKAQQQGCLVGWDLCHAVGNVPLALHEWGVDFACWCSYKYACAGPGAVAGMFLHERYAGEGPEARRRLLGWWGHRPETRMEMANRIELAEGAAGYRLSGPSPLLMAGVRASLEVFGQTSMEELRRKSMLLTGYMEFLLDSLAAKQNGQDCEATFTLISPRDPAQRGCQLSLKFNGTAAAIYGQLAKRGVVVDKRCPDVIRVSPVHLYNSFEDVWRFVQALNEAIEAVKTGELEGLAK